MKQQVLFSPPPDGIFGPSMPKALCGHQVTPMLPLLGPWDLVLRAVTGVAVTGLGRPYRSTSLGAGQ